MIECCAGLAVTPPEDLYEARARKRGVKDINRWGSTPPLKFLLTGFRLNHRMDDLPQGAKR